MRYKQNIFPKLSWYTNNAVIGSDNITFGANGYVSASVPKTYVLPERFTIRATVATSGISNYSDPSNPTAFIDVSIVYKNGERFNVSMPIVNMSKSYDYYFQTTIEPGVGEYSDEKKGYEFTTFDVKIRSRVSLVLLTYSLYKTDKDVIEEDPENGISYDKDTGKYKFNGDFGGLGDFGGFGSVNLIIGPDADKGHHMISEYSYVDAIPIGGSGSLDGLGVMELFYDTNRDEFVVIEQYPTNHQDYVDDPNFVSISINGEIVNNQVISFDIPGIRIPMKPHCACIDADNGDIGYGYMQLYGAIGLTNPHALIKFNRITGEKILLTEFSDPYSDTPISLAAPKGNFIYVPQYTDRGNEFDEFGDAGSSIALLKYDKTTLEFVGIEYAKYKTPSEMTLLNDVDADYNLDAHSLYVYGGGNIGGINRNGYGAFKFDVDTGNLSDITVWPEDHEYAVDIFEVEIDNRVHKFGYPEGKLCFQNGVGSALYRLEYETDNQYGEAVVKQDYFIANFDSSSHVHGFYFATDTNYLYVAVDGKWVKVLT